MGAYLQASAEACSAFGVEFKGVSTLLDSADTMIALIADHFGFDPETGKDL
jgi:hypothetical protein